jgi:hypothetical protein
MSSISSRAKLEQFITRVRTHLETFVSDVRRHEPPAIAAAVNAVVVLLVPIAAGFALSIVSGLDVNRTTVVAFPIRTVLVNLVTALLAVEAFLPLALIAGWRTWVHARRYRAGLETGWRGVAEAGLSGFVVALIILGPHVARRPFDAPPYIAAYGGFALLVGLVLGLILRTSAIVVLRYQQRSSAS